MCVGEERRGGRGVGGGWGWGGRSGVGGTDTVIHRGCRRCFKGQGDPGETIRVREDGPLPFQGARASQAKQQCVFGRDRGRVRGLRSMGIAIVTATISGGCRPGPRELIGCKMAQPTNYHFDGQAQGCRGGNEAEARTRHVTMRCRPQTGVPYSTVSTSLR